VSILTLDDYIGSQKEIIQLFKTGSITAVAGSPSSIFAAAGQPGAGVLSAGNTANGIVPTDAVAGYPRIGSFPGGAKGYLSRVSSVSSVACMLGIYDRVFSAGAYSFNASQVLSSQPSYVGRVPGGDYSVTELWYEQVTAGTLVQNVAVTYLDEAGGAGSTGVIAMPAAMIAGRCQQLPLAAGDSGVSRIDTVTGTIASAGTFNINVLRPLWKGMVAAANYQTLDDLIKTGLPELFEDSALFLMVTPISTATGLPSLSLEIAKG
jgi:hypothetical protein